MISKNNQIIRFTSTSDEVFLKPVRFTWPNRNNPADRFRWSWLSTSFRAFPLPYRKSQLYRSSRSGKRGFPQTAKEEGLVGNPRVSSITGREPSLNSLEIYSRDSFEPQPCTPQMPPDCGRNSETEAWNHICLLYKQLSLPLQSWLAFARNPCRR